MSTSKEERNRILHMVESGQVTATEAAQILDTLEPDSINERTTERGRDRLLRIRTTTLNARSQPLYLCVLSEQACDWA